MSMDDQMQTQSPQGHSYGQVTVTGGHAQLGDQYVTTYQDQLDPGQRHQLQLLQSLRYPEMNARRNEIAEVEYRSFQWAFEDKLQPGEGHPSLGEWLRSGNGIFHVQGKAGSGKSTFMKFIFENLQTEALLQQWSSGQPVTMLFHSFWLAGQKIQCSWKGFLASVLSQIILAGPAFALSYRPRSGSNKHSLADWSEKELEAYLREIFRLSNSPKCLFLDALDEFDQDDDIDRLLDFVDELESSPNACKICLSARPVEHIDRHFESASLLRLHELTQSDIHDYVFETLNKKFKGRHESQDVVSAIASMICWKAEGVFLWVHYVLHHVCRGIRLNDDVESLVDRIESLPPGIGDLYRQMWNLQNPRPVSHLQDAHTILSLSRYLPMALFQLAIAVDRGLMDEYLTTVRSIGHARMNAACNHMQARLAARTAGLLECVVVPLGLDEMQKFSILYEIDPSLGSRGHETRRMVVKFLHGTVKSFLSESEEGRQMCSSSNPRLKEDCDTSWIQSYLACLIENVYPLTVPFVETLTTSPAWQGAQQSRLYDAVNHVCGRLVYERWKVPGSPSGSWFNDLQRATGETSTSLDFEGLLCGISFFSTRHIIHAYGTGWSAYYKGYLAMCSVLSCIANRSFINQNQDEITLRTVRFLKQNGADLTSLHPYPANNDVLSIRSAASRLVHQCCVALLNIEDTFPSLSYVGQVVDILEDITINEDITLMWNRNENRWSASLSEGLNIIVTFQGSQLHKALNQATAAFKTHLESVNKSDRLGKQISQSLRHEFYQSLATLRNEVSLCMFNWMEQPSFHKYPQIDIALVLRCIYDGGAEDFWSTSEEVQKASSLEVSDIDFTVEWCETLLALLKPLNPYEEIIGNEWKTKGALRDYF